MPEKRHPTDSNRSIGGRFLIAAAAALGLSGAPVLAEPAPNDHDDAALAALIAERLEGAGSGLSFGPAGRSAGSHGLADGTDAPAAAGAAGHAGPEGAGAGAPPIDKLSEEVLRIGSADELIDLFEAIGFSYVAVRDNGRAVPRLQVAAFPGDIDQLNTLFLRKSAFFNTLLPIVLQVNEDILADRRRLLTLRARLRDGGPTRRQEDRWLHDLAERYEVEDRDLDDLAVRVDIIPPSMALAMAAVESGWGTSSLAREANALFGQITAPGEGIEAASGHTYATFGTLRESVAAYARNLNTHGAYLEFRALRRAMRQAGDNPDGYRLIGALEHYSELGNRYIAYIRRLMRDDELHRMDDARLAPEVGERPS